MSKMNPTLLILAAGLGRRYGGVKQMDKVGPSGESIIDYSIYDAIRAKFKKVVFVLNEKIIEDFKAIYEPRLRKKIEIEYVIQKLSDIPEGMSFSPDRKKPWGTAHAVLAARNHIHEPFAVINADDFYGRQAYQLVSSFLLLLENKDTSYAMIGYRLNNTLSDHGSVSRGVCRIKNNYLTDIVERTKILRKKEQIVFNDQGKEVTLAPQSVVSMNFWGFTPRFFSQTETEFRNFVRENAHKPDAEFYIPSIINKLIKAGEASCKVLTSNDKWFGVTYQEDKPTTIEKINHLIELGIYPENLWR